MLFVNVWDASRKRSKALQASVVNFRFPDLERQNCFRMILILWAPEKFKFCSSQIPPKTLFAETNWLVHQAPSVLAKIAKHPERKSVLKGVWKPPTEPRPSPSDAQRPCAPSQGRGSGRIGPKGAPNRQKVPGRKWSVLKE